MALRINTKYNGKECKGILRIQSVNSTRGMKMSSGSGFSAISKNGASEPYQPKEKFFTNIEYTVEVDTGDKPYTYRGTATHPYDLNSKKNIFEHAYNIVKTLDSCKGSEDC